MNNIMIRNVPKSWRIYRLGQLFRERKEKGNDIDFPPLSVTKRGIMPQLDNVAKTDDRGNRKVIRVGDYVINSRSDRKGSGGVSALEGSTSQISIVLEPINILPQYAHHLLRSYAFQEEFYRWGHGIVADLWTTRYSDMKNIFLAIPNKQIQEKIASFLDKETARLDLLIEKKLQMIKFLHEYRMALIFSCTTKYPSVDMQLRNCVDIKYEKDNFSNVSDIYIALEHVESWTGKTTISDVTIVDAPVYKFKKGDILFGKLGPYLAKVVLAKFDGVCSPELLVFRNKKEILNRFIQYSLLSSEFIGKVNASAYGVKMPRTSWMKMKSELIKIPSLENQHKIVKYLDKETSKIDLLTQKNKESIALLREYKQALITNAVTGQIDIEAYKKG